MSAVVSVERSRGNTFTALGMDRVPPKRREEIWVTERLTAPDTRIVLVCGSEILVTDESTPRAALLRPGDLGALFQQAESIILLGETEVGAYFVVGVSETDELDSRLVKGKDFRDLRAVAPVLDEWEAALLAYAKAMVYWHHRHQFCGDCGSRTRSTEGGHLRVCTNPACGQHHFPRTDPAIIVLVTSDDRCLLGRQPTWPKGLYSIIAGFVEPGESLEGAVAREVREETGVQVCQVRYQSSQPWPFPSSLMLGFRAEATSTTIRLTDGELEDAQWLSRSDVVQGVKRGTLRLPRRISISYRLVRDWFDAGGSMMLQDLVGSR